MSVMVSQITGVSIVCSAVCSGADQRKHQNSASLDFVRRIHRWPMESPHKGTVTQKIFPFMTSSWHHHVSSRPYDAMDERVGKPLWWLLRVCLWQLHQEHSHTTGSDFYEFYHPTERWGLGWSKTWVSKTDRLRFVLFLSQLQFWLSSSQLKFILRKCPRL